MEVVFGFIIHVISWIIGLASSILFYILILPGLIFILIVQARILNRAGFSGWWALLSLIPPLWIIGVWLLAFARWPSEDLATIEIIPPRH